MTLPARQRDFVECLAAAILATVVLLVVAVLWTILFVRVTDLSFQAGAAAAHGRWLGWVGHATLIGWCLSTALAFVILIRATSMHWSERLVSASWTIGVSAIMGALVAHAMSTRIIAGPPATSEFVSLADLGDLAMVASWTLAGALCSACAVPFVSEGMLRRRPTSVSGLLSSSSDT